MYPCCERHQTRRRHFAAHSPTEVPYAVDGILFTEAASDDPGVSERRIQLIDERDDLRSIGHDQSVTIGDLFNIEFPPILAERPSSAPQC